MKRLKYFLSLFSFIFLFSVFNNINYAACTGSEYDGCCYRVADGTNPYCVDMDEAYITSPLDPDCVCQSGLDCRKEYSGGTTFWTCLPEEDWCGLDGEDCCIDNGTTWCYSGYECNLDGGPQVCESDACGHEGGPCCAGYKCDPGLGCDTALDECVDKNCGALNDPCCLDGDGCDGDLFCNQDYDPPLCKEEDNPRYSPFIYRGPIIEDLASLLAPIVKILYFAGIIIGVAVIIYSGYIFMLSQGNPQQTEEGSNWLTSAVIGILFILLSVAIFRVIITSLLNLSGEINF